MEESSPRNKRSTPRKGADYEKFDSDEESQDEAARDPRSSFDTDDEEEFGLYEESHPELNYKDTWPQVEVTIEVRECFGLNVVDRTVQVDFDVKLDWLDFQLLETQHFHHDNK
eukprot:gene47-397_t